MSFSPVELGLILLIVIVIFGVGKVSQVGGALGKSVRDFRDAMEGRNDTPTTGGVPPVDGTAAGNPPTYFTPPGDQTPRS